MTTYDNPLWMQALTYPAGVDRDLIDATFPNPGVIAAAGLAVTQRGAGANMSVDVAAGLVVVAGTDIAGQGKYLGKVNSTVNVVVGAAPGAGLTRVDLVHAHMTDGTVVGGGTNAMAVQILAGTAVSSNPVPPAVPASSEALANITVASGTAAVTNAMIADRRRRAQGQRVQGGRAAFTYATGGVTITFPTPFATTCYAFVSTVSYTGVWTTFVSTLSASQAKITISGTAGEMGNGSTGVYVDWMAVGD